MGLIELSELGMSFEEDRVYFRDQGIVPNVQEYVTKFVERLDPPNLDEVLKHVTPTEGKHFEQIFRRDGELVAHLHHITYIGGEQLGLIYRRGHEETHALHAMGKLDLLQDHLSQSGINVDLSRHTPYRENLYEDEYVANIGAYFALFKRGFDLTTIRFRVVEDHKEDPLQVMRDLTRGRVYGTNTESLARN